MSPDTFSTSPEQDPAPEAYPAEVVRCLVDGKEVVLVGTAHVSKESAELVREVIRRERPDRVCVELDARRLDALSNQHQWENLDLKQLIRNRQLSTLLVNLLLAAYQKRVGMSLGVLPGTELLEAVRAAEEQSVPVSLSDRDVRVTMLRAWRTMSFWQKWKLLAALLAGLFGDTTLSEEDLRELRRGDLLSEMMEELARLLPSLKQVLIDERDLYLAEEIRSAEGRRIVAVVGAGHLEGIERELSGPGRSDLAPLRHVPPSWSGWKWVGWGVPALVLGSLAWIGWSKGGEAAGDNAVYWILANGLPCALGALIAAGHPLTVVAGFVSAPFTSLTPVIGAGYVTAFVQAYLVPPRVRDFRSVAEDAAKLGMWWKNRLLRVFLAFVLPSIGSMIGTYLGGYRLFSNLF